MIAVLGLASGACLYLGALGTMWLLQRRLQYLPDRANPAVPLDAHGLREVELATEDGLRLRAWHWPGERPVTFLLFHGNSGHRGHRIEWMRDMRRTLGVGVFVLDYRGYGGSEGTPNEQGLYLDALAAVRWLEEHVGGELVYLGESLGCSVALAMAERRPPAALLVQSGSACLLDVARDVYPYLPCSWIMKDRFDARPKLARITCPTLAIHGDRDDLIAPEHGRALFAGIAGPKEWYEVRGAAHNDVAWVGGAQYRTRIRSFLEAHGILR